MEAFLRALLPRLLPKDRTLRYIRSKERVIYLTSLRIDYGDILPGCQWTGASWL